MNHEKLETIIDLATSLMAESEDVAEAPQEVWTDEYISMLVSGTPDLHIRNQEQFKKMAPYADPLREPFTASTWMMTGWGGKDSRPMKAVEVDGEMYRPMPKAYGPDWYFIARGVLDVTEPRWLKPVNAPLNPSRKEMLENCRNYMGGLNQSLDTWPADLREAYEV